MRVITGRAKGRKLMSVPGDSTRPITDRAKSALFSILSNWIEGTRVLDLFGGTGAVGIECLSRGATYVHFLDNNRKAVETIQTNLAHCGFSREATVERNDSFAFLERYRGEAFDFIYVAPPQYQDLWRKALQLIDARPELTAEYATIVVQIHPVEDKPDKPVELQRLQEYDRRKYGSVMLIFYADARDLEEKQAEEGTELPEEDAGGEDEQAEQKF
jgi:16S rRNA (guanine(966)-N(2))-methyltransferase RsmD